MFVNKNRFDFGTRHDKRIIDDVVLPPWAHGDPRYFVDVQRRALESEHVSRHVHRWIDLVFGYQQQGAAAIEAGNVFHHLSYAGAVDIDAIADPLKKEATLAIIQNFGQTPCQLFRKPHPTRAETSPSGLATPLTISQNPELLIGSQAIVCEVDGPVGQIRWLQGSERKSVAVPKERALCPNSKARVMEWGRPDGSLLFLEEEKVLRAT